MENNSTNTITISTEEYAQLVFAADHLAMCRDVLTTKRIKYESDRKLMLKIILGVEEQEGDDE